MEYLMQRFDSLPTSHLIFVLVLYNHKVCNQVHKFGSLCLNTEDIYPYTMVDDLEKLWYDNDDRKKLQRTLYTFASNGRRTNPYWASKRHELKVYHFFSQILIICILQFFHTSSIAEYHVVGCVFFHLNINHVLMIILKLVGIQC